MPTERTRTPSLSPLLPFILIVLLITAAAAVSADGGRWQLLQPNIGISAMHMQLLHNDRVVIFDRTDFGPSNLSLPDSRCRDDPRETALTHDCTAHSVEYDVASSSLRPLMVLTDTWCSSGSVDPTGALVQTGGFNDGDRAARIFRPCPTCDWEEDPTALNVRRWYATNHLLPDGRQIVIGGRRQFNYEFYPKAPTSGPSLFDFPLLRMTRDVEENNLYPFVHLNVDGTLFVFSNNKAILLDYAKNAVVKTFPMMPGADPRNYPSSGSSVLLPLSPSGTEAEVLVCGGAPRGAYPKAQNGTFVTALNTCGRIKITDPNPSWTVETMPMPRVMGDMVLLPSGNEVLIINGAGAGTAGWEFGANPVLSPVIYNINNPVGSRFQVQNPSAIPRLYHSTAVLLRDGRVLIGGSNPHIGYSFYGVKYPTELSLEAFSPEYLSPENVGSRPKINTVGMPVQFSYGQRFTIRFTVVAGGKAGGGVSVTMVKPPFTTHSYSMNQRMLVLEAGPVRGVGTAYAVDVVAPKNGVMAPAGYYMLFVSSGGIPSEGVWVHVQ